MNAMTVGINSTIFQTIQAYFDLMYDCDVTRFDKVFHSTAQLHGVKEGVLTMWPAVTYREVLEKRESPKSKGALREEGILLVDVSSRDQALAKVRVRIHQNTFVDYLTLLNIEGEWKIVAKAFHVEQN